MFSKIYSWFVGRMNYYKITNVFREDALTTEGMVLCVEVDKHMNILSTGAFITVVQVMLVKFFLFVPS